MKRLILLALVLGCGSTGDVDLSGCISNGKTIAEYECGPGSYVGGGCDLVDAENARCISNYDCAGVRKVKEYPCRIVR